MDALKRFMIGWLKIGGALVLAVLAYTILYATARFVLEFFRGDADRGFVFGGLLSTSQFIGAILGLAAIAPWLVLQQRAR